MNNMATCKRLNDIYFYLNIYQATLDENSNLLSNTSVLKVHCAFDHAIYITYDELMTWPILCKMCENTKEDRIKILNESLINLKIIDINQYQAATVRCKFGHTSKYGKDEIPNACKICLYYKNAPILNDYGANIEYTNLTENYDHYDNNEYNFENEDDLHDEYYKCDVYSDNESMVDYSIESDSEIEFKEDEATSKKVLNDHQCCNNYAETNKMLKYFNQMQLNPSNQSKHYPQSKIIYTPNPPKEHIRRESNVHININIDFDLFNYEQIIKN